MPITEKQKLERKKHIGSSDMPAVLGISPFKSAYDVWLEKTGRISDEDDVPNEAMQAGNALENWVLDQAEAELGKMKRNVQATCKVLPVLVANIDAVRKSDNCPVEAKTVGLYHPSSERWGEPGTDQVPERVIVQCAVHQTCLGVEDVCFVPAFIAHRGLVIYGIPYSKKLADLIIEKAGEFWEKYVVKDIPPEDSFASIEYVKRMRRMSNKVVELPKKLYYEWQDLKAQQKVVSQMAEEAQAKLLSALGDGEIGIVEGEDNGITYFEQGRNYFDVKSFRQDNPELYKKYCRKNVFRTLRSVKKIQEYVNKGLGK